MMLRWLVFLTLLWLAAGARAESLTDIDAVVARAGSLDALLGDPTRLDEYYGALRDYYGAEKFPRNRFDAIITQLRGVVAQIPELKTRLWETTNLGAPFALEAAVKGRGRGFDAAAWGKYFGDLSARVRESAAPIYALASDARADHVAAVFARAAAALEEARRQAAPAVGRAAQVRRDAEIFGRLKSDPEVRAAVAYLVSEKLHDEHTQDLFRAGDADVILHFFEGLRGEPRAHEWPVTIPEGALGLIGEHVPPLRELMARQDVFPVRLRETNRGRQVADAGVHKGEYRAVPLPRRLHGIWKGISLGECVGGSPDKTYDKWLTPERWLTVALKDTALWHIEGEGGYHGFVQAVPIRVGGKIYGSVDFGSPLLAKQMQEIDPLTGTPRPTKIFAPWIERLLAHKPAGWEGFVVGKSNAINNAGVLATARASSSFELGHVVGTGADMRHFDDRLADAIVSHSVLLDSHKAYKLSRMIFDAGVMDAGDLRLLKSVDQVRTELLGLSHEAFIARKLPSLSPTLLRDFFGARSRAGTADEALALVDKLFPSSPVVFLDMATRDAQRALALTVLEPWLKNASPGWLNEVYRRFYNDRKISSVVFERAELSRMKNAADFLASFGRRTQPTLKSDLFATHYARFAALEPTSAQALAVLPLVREGGHEVAREIFLRGLANAPTLEAAHALASAYVPLISSKEDFFSAHLPRWLARNPSQTAIKAFGSEFQFYPGTIRPIFEHLMKGARAAADYYALASATGAHLGNVSELASDHIADFLKTQPTAAEALRFSEIACAKSESLVTLLEYAARHAADIDEYHRVLDSALNVGMRDRWGRAQLRRPEAMAIVQASLSRFFGLAPDLAQVRKLEKRLIANAGFPGSADVIAELKVGAVGLVSGLPEYFQLAAVPADAPPQATGASEIFLRRTAERAESLRTAENFVAVDGKLIGKGAQDETRRILTGGLRRATKLADYVALLDVLRDRLHDSAPAVEATLADMLAKSRDADAERTLRARFAVHPEILAQLARAEIAAAKSPEDVARILGEAPASVRGLVAQAARARYFGLAGPIAPSAVRALAELFPMDSPERAAIVSAYEGRGAGLPELLAVDLVLDAEASLALRRRLVPRAKNDRERQEIFGSRHAPVRAALAPELFAHLVAGLAAAPDARAYETILDGWLALGRNERLAELASATLPHFWGLPGADEAGVLDKLGDEGRAHLREWIRANGSAADYVRLSARGFLGDESGATRTLADFAAKRPTVAQWTAHLARWPAHERAIFTEAAKTATTRAEILSLVAGRPGLREALRTVPFFRLAPGGAAQIAEYLAAAGYPAELAPVFGADPFAALRALSPDLRRVVAGFLPVPDEVAECNRLTAALAETAAREIFARRALEKFRGTDAAREVRVPSWFARSAGFHDDLRRLRPEGGVGLARRVCRFVGLVN